MTSQFTSPSAAFKPSDEKAGSIGSTEKNFLIVSGHDWRSKRKANIHYIADEVRKLGPTRFFSLGFSNISLIRGHDPRIGLQARANAVEHVDGVDCYLWFTPAHPINLRRKSLQKLTPTICEAYKRLAPKVFADWAREADTIIVESGLGVLFVQWLRKVNPGASILYIASDDLKTIGMEPHLIEQFARHASCLDGIRIPSRAMADNMPSGAHVFYVPHGIDKSIAILNSKSPYDEGLNAVSVGSMLFDPTFFDVAAERFPRITFHVIGSGCPQRKLPESIVYYQEMPHRKTIDYLKHADFGIAPYKLADAPAYLADTSMKLLQYEFLGLPAVCPTFVTGGRNLRFGYTPGNPESIAEAINGALSADRKSRDGFLSWKQVTERILNPRLFEDTRV